MVKIKQSAVTYLISYIMRTVIVYSFAETFFLVLIVQLLEDFGILKTDYVSITLFFILLSLTLLWNQIKFFKYLTTLIEDWDN